MLDKKNSYLISAYLLKNEKVYRNYYIVFNGIITQIKIDSEIEFVKNNVKTCPTYDYNDLYKIIKKDVSVNAIDTITFNEFKLKYGVK